MKDTPKLPDTLLDKFTPEEVLAVIDWYIAMVERHTPERTTDLYERAAEVLRPSREPPQLRW